MAERIAREIEGELAAGEGAESDAIRAEVRRRAAEGAVRFCRHHVKCMTRLVDGKVAHAFIACVDVPS